MKALATAAIAIASIALVGCAGAQTAPQAASSIGVSTAAIANSTTGSILLTAEAQDSRSVQYVGADINAARVTIYDASNNTPVAQASFTGAALNSHLNLGTKAFSFTVDNLKVNDGAHVNGYTYTAKVETFLDAAMTTAIGYSSSSDFSITANALTTVAMPSLTLVATPLGSASATVTVVDNAPAAVVIK